MKDFLFQLWVDFIVWFFGAWPPELRLLPHRRWLVALAFRLRWREWNRLSDVCWWLARVGSLERTQPALAACATRMLMGGIMDGRE